MNDIVKQWLIDKRKQPISNDVISMEDIILFLGYINLIHDYLIY